MYKNHGKHDQHYLVYKFTCFSCNPSCRRCLNHSITNSHSGFSRGVYSIRIGDPLEPKLLSYWILTSRCLLEWPPWLIRCMIETLVYLSCWSRGQMTLPPFSKEPLNNVYATLISWIWQRTMISHSNDLHEIDASTDFKWSMQDLGYLVSITNFEFLCRKLNLSM